ncbi:MAG: hypothetical protein JWL63_1534 [Rhodocyclales bacterium]|nr:hypothetical protein [Rhodocyclales bacterium]
MPFIAFFMLPVTTTRAAAMLDSPTLFSSAYLITFRQHFSTLPIAKTSNLIGAALYLYFAYLIFVGLRTAGKTSLTRSFCATVIALMGILVMQNYVGLPIEQALVRAATWS